MLSGSARFVGPVPGCLIHDEDCGGILCDMTGDFDQMLRHGIGVAAELRADCIAPKM